MSRGEYYIPEITEELVETHQQEAVKDAAAKEVEIQEEAAEVKEEQEYKFEQNNSHAAKEARNFGLRENIAELRNAVAGGTRDTVSSYLTLPERAADMASGAMVSEIQQK